MDSKDITPNDDTKHTATECNVIEIIDYNTKSYHAYTKSMAVAHIFHMFHGAKDFFHNRALQSSCHTDGTG